MVSPQAVIRYYDECRADYAWFWMDRRNLAMHYGYWDEQVRSHSEALLRLNAVLAEHAQITDTDIVLDAGCGVGGSALWLAAEHGARVLGITLSAAQAREARAHAGTRRLAERVAFDVRDFTSTGLPDASFTVVWAVESVCHANDKGAFFREAYRLLRPGGRLIMSDFFRSSPRGRDGDERTYRRWLDGWAVPDLMAPAEFEEMAADASFSEISLTDATGHIRRSARRLHRLSVFSLLGSRLLMGLHLRSRVQHGNTVAARDQYVALQAGLWAYCIASARR